jgi:TonB family protein
MRIHSLAFGILWLCLVWLALADGVAQTLERVDTKVALAQVLKKVDPVVPPVAQSARVGGTVIADVTISATGRVTAVNILAGPDLLHAAARTALQQWTFKPFIVRGQARVVVTILEVNFPDPRKEEQDHKNEVLRAANHECERQMDIDVAAAVPLCRKAMLATENVSVAVTAQTIGAEYERAWQAYLNALIRAGRAQDDVDILRRAIEKRAKLGRPDDRTSADAWATLGIVQARLGANADADASFSKSESMYSALIERTPRLMDSLVASFKGILTVHAALRRSAGDAAGADRLTSQAATLSLLPAGGSSPGLPTAPAPVTRRTGDIRIVETEPAQLTDEDVRRIQALLPGSVIAWMEITHVSAEKVPTLMLANVCLKAVAGRSGLRRGRCEMLDKSRPDGRGQGGGWRKMGGGTSDYVLFGDVSDDKRTRVTSRPNEEPLSDARLLSIQQLLARKAVAAPTDRLKSDIQPWRISSIVPYQGNDIIVILSADDGVHSQSIVVRPVGDGWNVVDIR